MSAPSMVDVIVVGGQFSLSALFEWASPPFPRRTRSPPHPGRQADHQPTQLAHTVFPLLCAGGAAGCAVAGRLAAADPTLQVALIEAGIVSIAPHARAIVRLPGPATDKSPLWARRAQNNKDLVSSHQPAMYLSHIAATSTTASFYSSTPSDALNGRTTVVPCGNVLGGGE